MLSYTEENYIKAILQLTLGKEIKEEVGTNELAANLGIKPATATDMLKKLKEKELIDYKKYGKISLTAEGKKKAIAVVRRHRLWETFLYEKLGFTWDEVHEIAEQLEHIQSEKLVAQLDKFLGYPEFDPHGDAIPNEKGEMKQVSKQCLSEVAIGQRCKMVAVKDNSAAFLQYVAEIGLSLNEEINIISKQTYDENTTIEVNKKQFTVSKKFTDNIFVI